MSYNFDVYKKCWNEVDKKVLCFSHPKSFCAQQGTMETITLLRIWVTHGVPPWKIVWELFFDKGLIRHLITWETLHFQGFNMDMAF